MAAVLDKSQGERGYRNAYYILISKHAYFSFLVISKRHFVIPQGTTILIMGSSIFAHSLDLLNGFYGQ